MNNVGILQSLLPVLQRNTFFVGIIIIIIKGVIQTMPINVDLMLKNRKKKKKFVICHHQNHYMLLVNKKVLTICLWKSLFILRLKNCGAIPPRNMEVFYSCLSITDLTQIISFT